MGRKTVDMSTFFGTKMMIALVSVVVLVCMEFAGISEITRGCYAFIAGMAYLSNGLSALGWNIDLPGKKED